MNGTFFGAEIGLRALRAAQVSINTASNNIANVNTKGYSRQRAELTTTDPLSMPSATRLVGAYQIGTGVMATTISQARDAGLDRQLRNATSDQQELIGRQEALAQVEDAIAEPGTEGVSAALTTFFNSFQSLAGNAESTTLRDAAVASANALATTFHQVRSRLDGVEESLNESLKYGVAEVNNLSGQIAKLNEQIRHSMAAGDAPNDLVDRRELLLESLSSLVKTTVVSMPDGTVSVATGGFSLVQGENANTAASIADLTAGGNKIGGQLQGVSDEVGRLSAYRNDLDGLAAAVIEQVNTLHNGGVDAHGVAGLDLFTGTDARTIAVDPAIAADTSLLAASSTPVPPATFAAGNGDNALAIAGLATKAVTSGPVSGETLRQFWSGTATSLGVEVKSLKDNITGQDAYVRQVEARRESVSGVSLDDEMADMLRFQRAYQAAAKLISIQDEMVSTIIESLGGR